MVWKKATKQLFWDTNRGSPQLGYSNRIQIIGGKFGFNNVVGSFF